MNFEADSTGINKRIGVSKSESIDPVIVVN